MLRFSNSIYNKSNISSNLLLMIRKQLSMIIFFTILLSISNASGVPKVKVGELCKTKNSVIKQSGKVFKCTFTKNKLVWLLEFPPKASKNSTTSARTILPTKPTPTPDPKFPTAVIKPPVLDWDFEISNGSIDNATNATILEKKVSESLRSQVRDLMSSTTNNNITIRIEPNTSKAIAREWMTQIEKTESFLTSIGMPTSSATIIIGKNKEWIRDQFKQINCIPPGGFDYYLTRGAGLACDGQVTTLQTEGLDPELDKSFFSEVTYYVAGSHEWVHISQKNAAGSGYQFLPLWITEGSANLIATIIAYNLYPDARKPVEVDPYLFYRNRITNLNVIKNQCSKGLNYYLFEQDSQFKESMNDTCSYNIGQLALEKLLSQDDGIMKFGNFLKSAREFKEFGAWKVKFSEIFGLSQSQILASVAAYFESR